MTDFPELPWADSNIGGETGPGWWPIIERLNADLLDIAPDYQVVQVKEKFGGLRYYVSYPEGRYDAIEARIREAEAEADRTCEWCGAPGEVRGPGWLKALCDPCQEKKQAGWRPWMDDETWAKVQAERAS